MGGGCFGVPSQTRTGGGLRGDVRLSDAPAVAAHPSPHQKAAKTAKASKTKEKQGKANAEVEKNVKPMEM